MNKEEPEEQDEGASFQKKEAVGEAVPDASLPEPAKDQAPKIIDKKNYMPMSMNEKDEEKIDSKHEKNNAPVDIPPPAPSPPAKVLPPVPKSTPPTKVPAPK